MPEDQWLRGRRNGDQKESKTSVVCQPVRSVKPAFTPPSSMTRSQPAKLLLQMSPVAGDCPFYAPGREDTVQPHSTARRCLGGPMLNVEVTDSQVSFVLPQRKADSPVAGAFVSDYLATYVPSQWMPLVVLLSTNVLCNLGTSYRVRAHQGLGVSYQS